MNNATQPNVTQAVRDAAADSLGTAPWDARRANRIRTGDLDHGIEVQTFAQFERNIIARLANQSAPTSEVREALETLRQREFQMMGAAISTRSWHDLEMAYNQARDRLDSNILPVLKQKGGQAWSTTAKRTADADAGAGVSAPAPSSATPPTTEQTATANGDAVREPVAWIKPDWQNPETFDGMSPVATYRRNDWLPLYLSQPPEPQTVADGLVEAERFLIAYVSEDAKVIGIEHETEADWNAVQRAHEALRDRLNVRLAEREKCPFRPANEVAPSGGEGERTPDAAHLEGER